VIRMYIGQVPSELFLCFIRTGTTVGLIVYLFVLVQHRYNKCRYSLRTQTTTRPSIQAKFDVFSTVCGVKPQLDTTISNPAGPTRTPCMPEAYMGFCFTDDNYPRFDSLRDDGKR